MIALTGYRAVLDYSADHDLFIFGGAVVAGFVSTVEQWSLWEGDWNKVLHTFEVPYFHRKEFELLKDGSLPKGAFRDEQWKDEGRRRDFVYALAHTLKTWASGTVGAYMPKQMYRDALLVSESDKTFNPYAECGRQCALFTKAFVRETLASDLPIVYVFEDGDKGKGQLFDMMKRSELPSPVFKRPRFNPKKTELDKLDPPIIALQAADLLAAELRRWKVDSSQKKRMRQSLKVFLDMKHIVWKECTYTDIARLIHSAQIPRKKARIA